MHTNKGIKKDFTFLRKAFFLQVNYSSFLSTISFIFSSRLSFKRVSSASSIKISFFTLSAPIKCLLRLFRLSLFGKNINTSNKMSNAPLIENKITAAKLFFIHEELCP